MELCKMNDISDGFKYDKTETCNSPVHKSQFLIDYTVLVKREGSQTTVQNSSVIDMDSLKTSLNITPMPKSMDMALIVSKVTNNQKKLRKYILADFKFKVTSLDKVDKNISNDEIKEKFNFSKSYISSVDFTIPCSNIAYFIFKDNNFEQIKNRWNRRNFNNPLNIAIKQSDFEVIF